MPLGAYGTAELAHCTDRITAVSGHTGASLQYYSPKVSYDMLTYIGRQVADVPCDVQVR